MPQHPKNASTTTFQTHRTPVKAPPTPPKRHEDHLKRTKHLSKRPHHPQKEPTPLPPKRCSHSSSYTTQRALSWSSAQSDPFQKYTPIHPHLFTHIHTLCNGCLTIRVQHPQNAANTPNIPSKHLYMSRLWISISRLLYMSRIGIWWDAWERLRGCGRGSLSAVRVLRSLA